MHRSTILFVFLTALGLPERSAAQPLGTFRWQLQPYCNVLSLTVTQVGGTYRLEGTDDQCGGGRDRASVIGMAFQNPDGTIGLGMTIVTAPGGTAVHVDAAIGLATLSGAWRDSAGSSGPFAFAPGAHPPGSPRPAASSTVPASISLRADGGIVARPEGDGVIPASGPGIRMMWYPHKAAFRAGAVDSSQWDDVNVGPNSAALGRNAIARGIAGTAFGENTLAFGPVSTAMGVSTRAIGAYSTAMGASTEANNTSSTAMGRFTVAGGLASTAMGSGTIASGDYSVATGSGTFAGPFSFAGGQNTSAAGDTTFAFGLEAGAHGVGSVALGRTARTTAAAPGSFMFADRSTSAPFESFRPNEFGARFAGGYYFYTSADLSTGAVIGPGGGDWTALSDANAKENFRSIDGEDLLARLARVPVDEWNYKVQGAAIRHIGPTAQDFRAAFGLGDFPLRINTIDASGVALAGVKALDARTLALRTTIAELQRANADLHARLARLEAGRQGK